MNPSPPTRFQEPASALGRSLLDGPGFIAIYGEKQSGKATQRHGAQSGLINLTRLLGSQKMNGVDARGVECTIM